MWRWLMVLAVLGVACHDDCDPGETRCAGARVEECAGDADWGLVEDCAAVGPDAWECCPAAFEWEGDPTAACVPAGSCGADAGQ